MASDLDLVRALGERFTVDRHGHAVKQPVPHRVLLVGSSSIEWGFGPALARQLEALGVVEVRNEGRMSTGLARPDFFDWPAEVERLLDAEVPDMVVAQFGGNDAQVIRDARRRLLAKWGEPGWEEAYRLRVRRIVEACVRRGVPLVFIGMPHMEDAAFARRIAAVNEIVTDEAVRGGARFVSTWELTSTEDGGVRTHFTRDGRRHLVRRDDGIHLGKHGAPWVAEWVAARMATWFDLTEDCDTEPSPERLGSCDTPQEPGCAQAPERCASMLAERP